MNHRTEEGARFLASVGWGDARRVPLAGDASVRRYERLTRNGDTAVLMDAPPDHGESTMPFTRMAHWLRGWGYSAPEIIAEDHAKGFLLLEDLGDALFARLIENSPEYEIPLYSAATDFLIDLGHRPTAPELRTLDSATLADLVALTPKWYLPGIDAGQNNHADTLPAIVAQLYEQTSNDPVVTSLRDFHAENLIWLSDRNGNARVGLLDFQDAVAAHPAYDLVSLLQDARRDVSPDTEALMLKKYLKETGAAEDRFHRTYALLGAQRALRIVGVFSRLTLHFGKTHYLDYLPRVWRYLERNLKHPALAPLADCVRAGLPEPTPDRIERIKDQCGQYPMP